MLREGTSPSIAALANGGYQMAYQTPGGLLGFVGPTGTGTTNTFAQAVMMAGTSPSIAVSPEGGYQVAFQGANGNLFLFSPMLGVVNVGREMWLDTSPCIASQVKTTTA
jgi:hypothetical protein